MAKVSLRNYDREIESLIEHGQHLDEAIAHCRNILKTFPKHLETYRLLGKAYLESKRYKEAVDVFQRVLVAAPDDFVSHVGMSIIADDQGKLDDAIWHMERAFEVQPSNAAIQGELQRLFGRRDGVEPPKIRLTRGALAHMYVQGELYNQAVSEVRAVLGNDPQRTDMQVLLAKAYFRNGQKAEATDICSQLLRRFPYCLDANRIMVEVQTETQRTESTQVYRRRVQELDPYAAFAQESLFRTDEVADAAVNLERLEYSGQAAADAAPSWSGKLGLEADATAIGSASSQPEWLKAASPPDTAASPGSGPAVNRREASIEETPPISQAKDEIPDFLRQAGWGESSGNYEEGLSSSSGRAEPASPAVQGDLPDWVKSLAPAGESDSVPQPAAPSDDAPDWLRNLGASQPAESAASLAKETPDWLKNLGARDLDEPVSETPQERGLPGGMGIQQPAIPQPEPSSESPDWLKGFASDLETPIPKADLQGQPKMGTPPALPVTPGPSQSMMDDFESQPPAATGPDPAAYLGGLGTSAAEQDDAMAWLESLAAKHGAKPEELVTDPNARSEVAPEWVDKAKAMGESPPAQTSAEPEDRTGIWLRHLEASEADTFISKQGGQEPVKPESSDWLGDLGSASVEKRGGPVGEEVPDWLRGTSSPAMQHLESSVPQEFSSESASATDLPEWLAGLDKEETPARPGVPADDLPNWLQGEVEPPIAEPTRPADWRPVEPKAPPEQFAVPEMESAVGESGPQQQPAPKPERKIQAPPRPKPAGVSSKNGEPSLGAAQAELGRGNIAAALAGYSKFIRKGKFLEEIIRDLREALYRYPVEVPIWQALGDAYMRANRLQEALDAYTKAEELLR